MAEIIEEEASIRSESRDRYLSYALSVITGRALPDVRDGLKPVQRRILYAMSRNLGLRPASSHRKSAAVVGEVLARYHPHGDSACYEAMVRMAQPFSLRYPLVDGQGNFGSLDGDSAAAYRYTEAKLLPFALQVLGEIEEETVPFRDNFDSTVQEPEVLPSRVPHLLVNGASGIAVGMATNIPPHNLREVVNALLALQSDPDISTAKLTTYVKGPDFPTGCAILTSKKELTEIYKSGRGSVTMRGDWTIETLSRGKKAIVVTTIPYAVNKSQLVEKTADLIAAKKVPQLLDVRDESTEDVRIVLELASGADAELAMAYLYKHTPLQQNFPLNLTALTPTSSGTGKPQLLSLKECLQFFLDFREEVVVKRLEFEKRNLVDRIHILEGFATIYDALDEALKIVRASEGRSDAAQKLRKRFKLSERQSFAIVDMRIYQLSKTNIDEIRAELSEKQKRVKEINSILKSRKKVQAIVKEDLETIANEFGDTRKSKLVTDHVEIELQASDFVVKEEVYAIVTKDGWLKRIRQTNELDSTRIREGDSILNAHAVSTVDTILLFSTAGYLYSVPTTEFPSSSGYGTPVQKILKFRDGERIAASFTLPEEPPQKSLFSPSVLGEGFSVVLISKRGTGYSLSIEGLDSIKRNGKKIMKLQPGDELAAVTPLEKYVLMFTRNGSALQIAEKEIPSRNSPAVGVNLMGIRDDDQLIGAVSIPKKSELVLQVDSGKERTITSSEVGRSRRGLKGKKIVKRGMITGVRLGGEGV